MDYIEIIDEDKHYLINLEQINMICYSPSQITIYNSSGKVSIPCNNNDKEGIPDKQQILYNKLYNYISGKQKKVKEIKI